MKPLGEMQRESLRTRLEQRAEQLRTEIAEAIRASEGAPPTEPGSRASNVERDTRVAALERDAEELNRVTEALARVESVRFGQCIDCDQPIAWPRLEAEPHATRCLACAELEERRSRAPHASL